MKILIDVPALFTMGLSTSLERLSREYAVPKNGLIVRHSEASDNERWTLHASEEAIRLLDWATRLYPDAAPAIAEAIDKVPRS